jgi:hypothetical protein
MNKTHPPIQHITELFAYDGEEFITEAYRNLLDRDPDPHGLRYYLGRLALGYGKPAIVVQLATSPECKKRDRIPGIKPLIQQEKQAVHWLWGKFIWRSRLEKALNSQQTALMRLLRDLAQVQSALVSRLSQLTAAMDRVAVHPNTEPTPQRLSRDTNNEPTPQRLSRDTVRQLFIEILGREPESEDVITHHAACESASVLRKALLNSEEFQTRIAALPEYARVIFKRQLHALEN